MNLKLFTFWFTESREKYYQLSSLNPFRSCVLNGFLAFQHIINQRFVHKFCAPSINFYIVDVSFFLFPKRNNTNNNFSPVFNNYINLFGLLFQKTPTSNKNNNFSTGLFFIFPCNNNQLIGKIGAFGIPRISL